MKGIYTVARKDGTAVYVSYSPPGERQIREKVELVPGGRGFGRRLREAVRRAEKVLIRRKAAIVEGRHEIARPKPIAAREPLAKLFLGLFQVH